MMKVNPKYALAYRERLCRRLLVPGGDEAMSKQEANCTLVRAMKDLNYKQREVVKLRYGLGDGHTYTLEEVGHIFKITRERVRQIEAKALVTLYRIIKKTRLSSHPANRRRRNEQPQTS